MEVAIDMGRDAADDGGPSKVALGLVAMGWNESRVLDWIAGWERPVVLAGSMGHDAAVLAARRERVVICADQVVFGVHAEEGVAAARLGSKAVARTVSDLAATAALPFASLVCLRAPPEFDERRLKSILRGAVQRAVELGAEVVGGDLCAASGPAGLAVTALGELPGRRRPPGRDRARAGQVVLLTGPVGGSRLGRHLVIEPRVAAGRALWLAGATAMMDVSDGLGIDATRLARASSVQLILERVLIHRDAVRASRASGRSALDHALEDGEDHELIATLPAAAARRLLKGGLPGCEQASIVGRVEVGAGLVLSLDERRGLWRGRGFVHGEVQP